MCKNGKEGKGKRGREGSCVKGCCPSGSILPEVPRRKGKERPCLTASSPGCAPQGSHGRNDKPTRI